MQGLGTAAWPGRAQRLALPRCPAITLHLDGAHTALSMGEVGLWYRESLRGLAGGAAAGAGLLPVPVLVFYCGVDKPAEALLAVLAATAPWAQVHLVGGVGEESGGEGGVARARARCAALQEAWVGACSSACSAGGKAQVPEGASCWAEWLEKEEGGGGGGGGGGIHPAPFLHDSLDCALRQIERSCSGGAQVLVTGSLYLVGEALLAARSGSSKG